LTAPSPGTCAARPLPLQIWLVSLYLLIARASPVLRMGIALTIALVTVAVFPRRLWTSQLKRLGLLCAFLFFSALLFVDGIPSVLQVGMQCHECMSRQSAEQAD
jgi:hypothetical protein